MTTERVDGKELILALERIITNKPKSAHQILDELWKRYGLVCNVHTFYNNVYTLGNFVPIVTERKGNCYYYFLMEA